MRGLPRTARRQRDEVVQECAAGLVRIRRGDAGLSFAAPPLVRDGPVDEALVQRIATLLGIDRGEILDAEWADNGPGWVAVLLEDAGAVLAVRPGSANLDLGIVGAYPRARRRRSRCGRSSRRTASSSRTRSPGA